MKLTQTLCSVLVKSHLGPFVVSLFLQQVPVPSSMASSQDIAPGSVMGWEPAVSVTNRCFSSQKFGLQTLKYSGLPAYVLIWHRYVGWVCFFLAWGVSFIQSVWSWSGKKHFVPALVSWIEMSSRISIRICCLIAVFGKLLSSKKERQHSPAASCGFVLEVLLDF